MKKYILTSFFCILIFPQSSSAQETKWYNLPTALKTQMIGVGPTFFGVNLKGGIFLKKHFLLGASMEAHELFSSRKEAGVFLRKYVNSNRLSFFIQAGASYGSFQAWDLDMDNETPGTPPLYYRPKMNGVAGAEIRITPLISIEGEVGIGRIMNTDWWAPSIRSSINFRFHKK
ncbi:hypothetical protein [Dyadobacter sp. LHD-138]|uniref:hypothetical protein n=1 Tax=Dyadobacter sp. LHD-138 TaxID=3071413 RepID=UPI0027E060F1|nr:hypothetical protein [Dyadobacter sp. LHD-138]MDQ6482140.1 hypothetical protein [Dyadobacter sp. LHD-138]